MSSWPRVYLSGPITLGDRNHNLAQAHEAHYELIKRKCAVFNPITTMQLPFAWDGSIPHDTWMDVDLPWVSMADVIVRLPGSSVGADLEVEHAHSHNIPIVFIKNKNWDAIANEIHELTTGALV